MIRAALALLTVSLAAPVHAAPAEAVIGDLILAYDDADWLVTHRRGGFLLEPKHLELGCSLGGELRLEGTLLGQQQGFEHRRIVGQLRGEDGCAHADGAVRTRGGGTLRHAVIIPDHAT